MSNANLDNTPDEYIKQPTRLPVEEFDRIIIDERSKRNEPK
jgi:hypothetical protein